MDFNQIQELIRMVSKHKISELSLEEGEFKLAIKAQNNPAEGLAPVVVAQQPMMSMPVAPQAPAPAAAPAPKAEAPSAAAPASDDSKLLQIKSPMVGTFYRSPGPDKAAFVKIGDSVDAGSKVCIIEAMKLFNEIESEVKGKIVKIMVDDASPVEYDQVLFLVEPG